VGSRARRAAWNRSLLRRQLGPRRRHPGRPWWPFSYRACCRGGGCHPCRGTRPRPGLWGCFCAHWGTGQGRSVPGAAAHGKPLGRPPLFRLMPLVQRVMPDEITSCGRLRGHVTEEVRHPADHWATRLPSYRARLSIPAARPALRQIEVRRGSSSRRRSARSPLPAAGVPCWLGGMHCSARGPPRPGPGRAWHGLVSSSIRPARSSPLFARRQRLQRPGARCPTAGGAHRETGH